jgi:nucleoid DNA-binding protein
MPSRLSKVEIASELARRAGVSQAQAMAVLDAQTELAYEHASAGFVIPGIGVLSLTVRPERRMIMRFGPDSGKEIAIPAKTKLDFKISKGAKDAILGPLRAGQMPDELEEEAEDE